MEIIMNLENQQMLTHLTQLTHNLVVGRMVIHQRYRNTRSSVKLTGDPKPNQL